MDKVSEHGKWEKKSCKGRKGDAYEDDEEEDDHKKNHLKKVNEDNQEIRENDAKKEERGDYYKEEHPLQI